MNTRTAFAFVALMGFVSLFADLTYEGARGITGPYLAVLGASALAVGLASGLGEFAGYALRLVTGFWADRTKLYWTFTFVGYAVNLLAVPALALTGSWPWAVTLVVAERLGKAIRTPARDALLAQATAQIGHGKGFGFHELLDQIGAVAGPLAMAWVLARGLGFRLAFLLLGIPAVAALALLAVARLTRPSLQDDQKPRQAGERKGFSRSFPWLVAAMALQVAGFAHFQLVAFHAQKEAIVATAAIPLLFALAMLVDGVVALPVGLLFDRRGLATLAVGALAAIPVTALAFSRAPWAVALGVGLWGAVMGMQETVFKAAIAESVRPENRASAFGIFHAAYGTAWLLGSLIFGFLYNLGYPALVLYSCAMELLGVVALARTLGMGRSNDV
ncbi:MAG: MFS transporter [Thermoanaerobaculum sp.]